jgi:hypothetical protein
MTRLNMAADVGADMGLFFPRNDSIVQGAAQKVAAMESSEER